MFRNQVSGPLILTCLSTNLDKIKSLVFFFRLYTKLTKDAL